MAIWPHEHIRPPRRAKFLSLIPHLEPVKCRLLVRICRVCLCVFHGYPSLSPLIDGALRRPTLPAYHCSRMPPGRRRRLPRGSPSELGVLSCRDSRPLVTPLRPYSNPSISALHQSRRNSHVLKLVKVQINFGGEKGATHNRPSRAVFGGPHVTMS